jgi:hypothetical protein
MIDQKTVNREYPLPHADNKLREDVVRINDAFVDIDTDVNDLYAATGTLSTTLSAQVASLTQDTQNGNLWHADSSGSGTAYQVVLNPAPTVLNSGLIVHMKAHTQNTGPSTLNINSLGIKTIKKTDGSDLKANDILSGSFCFLLYDGTNFQLINPKVDQAQMEVINSNLMRAFEEIQENHGGALLMEAGWSDSFSNANDQGADEANSTGYQHDPTNTLYKGIDPGIGLNSDKDYDTESNYLQQEWTNANQITGQCTVTNSSATVTLINPDTWPTNCSDGRILLDGSWYHIQSRDTDEQITLQTNFTGITESYDYTIRLSEFNNGSVQLSDLVITSAEELHLDYSNYGGHNWNFGKTGGSGANAERGAVIVKPTSDGYISKVSFLIYRVGTPSDVFSKIYNVSGGLPTGSAIGTSDLHSSSGISSDHYTTTWIDFVFNPPIPISANTFYGVSLETVSTSASNYYNSLAHTGTGNPNNWATGPLGGSWGLQTSTYKYLHKIYLIPETQSSAINEYVSICDNEIQKTNSSAWSNVSSGFVTEILDSQNAYYWLAFDPVSGFDDGTEIKIFNPTDNVWRVIAKKNGTAWEYNNDSSNSATYSGTAATVNDMLHAVSQAISAQAGNRMTGVNLAAITDTQWEESGGWSTSVSSISRGITLYSNSNGQNPSVSQYRLNYDSERGAMDLRSKIYDPGFVPSEGYVWSRIEHTDSDGPGTFHVSRNGGTEWAVAPMAQQGLPLSGDIRIYRGTVDVNGQASGQDLRCRYQSSQGKDQFLHSWGLQAKS